MNIYKYIILTILCSLCLSCGEPFDMRLDDQPIICLESFPGVEDVVVFSIVPAYSMSNTALRPEFKPQIRFTVNGQEIPVILNKDHCVSEKYESSCYIADYKPVPGDKLTVEVSSEGFKSVHAQTSIPQPFPERKIDYRHNEIGGSSYDMVYVTFDDDGQTDQAYGLQVLHERIYTDVDGQTDTSSYRYGGDQIRYDYDFAPGSMDGIRIYFNGFSVEKYSSGLSGWDDDKFNGKSATLSMTVQTSSYGNVENPYDSFFEREYEQERFDEYGESIGVYKTLSHNKLVLYTMSEEFYKYAVAQELKDDNADFFAGLAPSNFCYTNVVDGYGVFAGVWSEETDWITREFIEDNR